MLRIDRNSERGVFISIKETLVTTSMPDINVNCEIIWAGLQFSDGKPLYISSYYGPHSNEQEALDELAKSLSTILHKQGSCMSNVIIGGDFNFADINWDWWSTTKPSTATDNNISSSFCHKICCHSWLRWSHGLCPTAS